MGTDKCKLNVEVCIKRGKSMKKKLIVGTIQECLKNENTLTCETIWDIKKLPEDLQDFVQYVKLCEANPKQDQECFSSADVHLDFYCYSLDTTGPEQENLSLGDDSDAKASNEWVLPSLDFDSLWESLIFSTDIKEQLLNFVKTTLLFSDQGVNNKIISWNKVVLLHGPPGTGKTSLCKALAQKLAIRMNHRYEVAQLVEVNSHSLFSKWFSESGKLVQKLFDKVTLLLENPKALVCVLIDEVESLTKTRAAHSAADPSDALRVVNAFLTQLDQIKRYPNVLILTTSNVTEAIDLAFVDRADIKQYIGYPSPPAIYMIYHSCLLELINKGIILPREQMLTYRQLDCINMIDNEATRKSLDLWEIAGDSVNISGRSLRKLPFLAQACFITSRSSNLATFLEAMRKALLKHKEDASKID